MNFRNLIYSAIIAISLSSITIAGVKLYVNGWKIPDHLTDVARELLEIGPGVTQYALDEEEFKELVNELMLYDGQHNIIGYTTKEEWIKLKKEL